MFMKKIKCQSRIYQIRALRIYYNCATRYALGTKYYLSFMLAFDVYLTNSKIYVHIIFYLFIDFQFMVVEFSIVLWNTNRC